RCETAREWSERAEFMPYLEGMARIDARLFVAMLAAAGRHSAEDLLPSVKVPTLAIAGGRECFTPTARSRAIAGAIPDAEFLEIPNASHTAPIEHPHLVNFTVRDFLARRIDRVGHAGADASGAVRGPALRSRGGNDRSASTD